MVVEEFAKEYVNSLSVGAHTVRFNYTDGYAETTLTIKATQTDNQTPDDNGKDNVPKTGDNAPIAWLFALMLISGTGIFITRKKKVVK